MTDQSLVDSFPDPTQLSDGEFAKSQQTREKILAAAVHCLAQTGYHKTSTTAVARAAGLSRTAMLYHYPSRAELMSATIQYVFRRRVEIQEQLQADVALDETFHSRSVDVAWQQHQTIEFKAFCELSNAARTDAELAEWFSVSFLAFDKARRDMSRQIAEPQKVAAAGFDLRCDITRFLLEGIAQQDGFTFNKTKRLEAVLGFLDDLWGDDNDVRIAALAEHPKRRN